MTNHLVAALHFESLAKQEHQAEERERLLIVAREFHWLAIAEKKRLVREIPKQPPAPSVKRREASRKRA
jgi:hypothetical protein